MLCVYMYVCIYIYIYTHTRIHICVYMHMCYTLLYICVIRYDTLYTLLYCYAYVLYTIIHYIYIYIYTHIYTNIYIHIYIITHLAHARRGAARPLNFIIQKVLYNENIKIVQAVIRFVLRLVYNYIGCCFKVFYNFIIKKVLYNENNLLDKKSMVTWLVAILILTNNIYIITYT